jgi:hypothetical protein
MVAAQLPSFSCDLEKKKYSRALLMNDSLKANEEERAMEREMNERDAVGLRPGNL